ncbi:MAG: THUMP domain-containing protein [Sulfolobales archaeon]
MYRYLLRLSGEIALKGRFRGALERILVGNISKVLSSDIVDIRRVDGGRIYVEAKKEVSDVLSRFFGVVEVLEVFVEDSKDLDRLARRARDLLCGSLNGKKFAVRARRSGVTGYTSLDAARIIGGALLECSSGVDLENPDIEVYVEIRGGLAYISTSLLSRRGYGGLPLGSSEKVLSLFSGGFDSPVATWMAMKRGSPSDLLHYVMGSLENTIRALKVGEALMKKWSLGYEPRVLLVDFSDIVSEIRSKVRRKLWQPALRRAMYVVGEILMREVGAEALVTGEAVWEASSQRLSALYASQKGIDALILRPLIGFDKVDIMRLSMDLGLYELSSKVVESCFIGSPNPIHVNADELVSEFSKIDRELFEDVAKNAIEIRYEDGWEEKVRSSMKLYQDVTIDTIPEGYIIIDITKRKGSGLIRGLEDLNEMLRRKEKIVLVCELGEASEALARHLRDQGYEVYSLRGGYKRLKELLQSKAQPSYS